MRLLGLLVAVPTVVACSGGGGAAETQSRTGAPASGTGLTGSVWAVCGEDPYNAGLCTLDLSSLEVGEVLPGEARISMVGGGDPLILTAAPDGPDELFRLVDGDLEPMGISALSPRVAADGSVLYVVTGPEPEHPGEPPPNHRVWRWIRGQETVVEMVPPGLFVIDASLEEDGSILGLEYRGPDFNQNDVPSLTRFREGAPPTRTSLGEVTRGAGAFKESSSWIAVITYDPDADLFSTALFPRRSLSMPTAEPAALLQGWKPLHWISPDVVLLSHPRAGRGIEAGTLGLAVGPTFHEVRSIGSISPPVHGAAPRVTPELR